jgi:multisubunit Na+/H+ antiporter MnhG subunit
VSALADLLIWTGVAVMAMTSVRLLIARDVHDRLHFVGPGSALAAPLVIAGMAVAPGVWTSAHDVLKILVIGALLFVTGPAAVVATARAVRGENGGDDG